jgi:hypothetical protein
LWASAPRCASGSGGSPAETQPPADGTKDGPRGVEGASLDSEGEDKTRDDACAGAVDLSFDNTMEERRKQQDEARRRWLERRASRMARRRRRAKEELTAHMQAIDAEVAAEDVKWEAVVRQAEAAARAWREGAAQAEPRGGAVGAAGVEAAGGNVGAAGVEAAGGGVEAAGIDALRDLL